MPIGVYERKEGKGKGLPYEFLYKKVKKAGVDRNIPFSLTYEEFLQFTQITKCHYCNRDIVWNKHNVSDSLGKRINSRYNLDRKDNSRGYVKDNLVVCCWMCNDTKGSKYSYDEMLLLSDGLIQIQQGRVDNTQEYNRI